LIDVVLCWCVDVLGLFISCVLVFNVLALGYVDVCVAGLKELGSHEG
jgi:hypothetical protein